MARQQRSGNQWVSVTLTGLLGVLVVVFVVKSSRRPEPDFPSGPSAKPLPAAVDVTKTGADHYLSVLGGYNWFAAIRARPAELLADQAFVRLPEPSRQRCQAWLRSSFNDVPPAQVREWTGVLASGYGLWVADLSSPLDPLPGSWRRLDKQAHGLPVYQVDGPSRLCGYAVLPNARTVVAATRFNVLDDLVVGTTQPLIPPRANLFGSKLIEGTFADLKYLRSPLTSVSLGPPPKDFPATGDLSSLVKPVDWVKDFGGGKASASWKEGVLQIEASFDARDAKTAAAIVEHLEEHRKRLLAGASGAGAAFTASGSKIAYKTELSAAELESVANRGTGAPDSRATEQK